MRSLHETPYEILDLHYVHSIHLKHIPAQIPGDCRPGLGEFVLDFDLDGVLGLAAAEVELLPIPGRVHRVPPHVGAAVHGGGGSDSDLGEFGAFLSFS